MYGVVLWSDRQRNCAVIWCEDHRNLAFYQDDTIAAQARSEFYPGDLVEFDLQEEDDMRMALSPSVVEEGAYPGLADDLIRAGQQAQSDQRMTMTMPGMDEGPAKVLPFPDMMDRANRPGASPRDRRWG